MGQAPSSPIVSRVKAHLFSQASHPVNITQPRIGATRVPLLGQVAPFNATNVRSGQSAEYDALQGQGVARQSSAVTRGPDQFMAIHQQEGPRVITAAEYEALQGQGISSQSHGRVSYASTRQEEGPRAFTVAEYVAMQGQEEYEGQRWVAPSATID